MRYIHNNIMPYHAYNYTYACMYAKMCYECRFLLSLLLSSITIQWNLRIRDTLGAGPLSLIRRLSLSRRLKIHYIYGDSGWCHRLCPLYRVCPLLGESINRGFPDCNNNTIKLTLSDSTIFTALSDGIIRHLKGT